MLTRLLIVFLIVLASSSTLQSGYAAETSDPSDLLGTWKVSQSDDSNLKDATLNLGIYGTLKLDLNANATVEGKYERSNNEFKTTIDTADGNTIVASQAIIKLSSEELVLKDSDGNVTNYQKTKNVFAPPTQAEWNAIASGGGYYEAWTDSDGTIYNELVYDEKAGLKYDLYIPAVKPKAESQGAIIMLHGGGWNSGSRKSLTYAARRYAKAGYITSLVSYSFFAPGNHITMDRLLDDIQHATSAIKEKTTGLGFHVDKLALFGISAGGHLALLYGYARADQSPIPVAFVFEQSGTTDFHADNFGSANTSARLVSALTGKEVSSAMIKSGDAAKLIDSISPLAYVNSKSVPTLLAYGDKDDIVLPIHGHKLAEKLKGNGVKHDYVAFPNSGHFLDSDPESRDRFRKLSLQYLREAFGY